MYINDIDRDEIRSGFLVTTDRKKLWNAQINLVVEFKRVCEKYNLRFFADSGTLLGAVRHHGFIPWDDDVDLIMLRDDYEKLKTVAEKEFRYPYYLDFWYENDIKPTKECTLLSYPFIPFAKLRDLRTTHIEFLPFEDIHQGIFIDIFTLDSCPPYTQEEFDHTRKFRALQEVFYCCYDPPKMTELLKNPSFWTIVWRKDLEDMLKMPLKERGRFAEKLLVDYEYYESKYVASNWSLLTNNDMRRKFFEREWFNETIYMPFENISIPVPKKFDEILKVYYEDWHEPKKMHSHGKNYSPDISYEKFFELRHNPINASENFLRRDSDEMRNEFLVKTNQKRFWKVQLNLIEQLKNLGCKFFAIDQTLYSVIKYRGFNPEDDYVRIGMTRSEFDKFSRVEQKFPYKALYGGGGIYFSDETTCMIDHDDQNISNGIFIEIIPVDYDPEIIQMPFEFTSIPVPKNFSELLKKFNPNFKKFNGDISTDISNREYFERMKS